MVRLNLSAKRNHAPTPDPVRSQPMTDDITRFSDRVEHPRVATLYQRRPAWTGSQYRAHQAGTDEPRTAPKGQFHALEQGYKVSTDAFRADWLLPGIPLTRCKLQLLGKPRHQPIGHGSAPGQCP